jgi:hypothetical protein
MARVLLRSLLVTLFLILATPAQGHAIEVAVSDDAAFSIPQVRQHAYDAAEHINATWVRTFLYGPKNLAQFQGGTNNLVDEYTAHGLNVEMTLNWNEWHINPEEDGFTTAGYVNFVKQAVSRFRNVKRFSILNEPDLSFHTTERRCGTRKTTGLRYKLAYHYRYTKKGLPRKLRKRGYVRRVRSSKRLRVPVTERVGTARQTVYVRGKMVKIRRKRTRLFRTVVRKRPVYRVKTFTITTKQCANVDAGARYRDLFRAAYAAIKSVRPDAQVWAGETSPHAYSRDSVFGIPGGFAASFMCQRPTEGNCKGLKADGWAHHPYQFVDPRKAARLDGVGGGITDACEQRDMLTEARGEGFTTPSGGPVPMYYTEFGYIVGNRKGWTAVPDAIIAQWLPIAWQIAKDCGAKQNLQYMLIDNASTADDTWDTSIFRLDGSARPQADALAAWTARQ